MDAWAHGLAGMDGFAGRDRWAHGLVGMDGLACMAWLAWLAWMAWQGWLDWHEMMTWLRRCLGCLDDLLDILLKHTFSLWLPVKFCSTPGPTHRHCAGIFSVFINGILFT